MRPLEVNDMLKEAMEVILVANNASGYCTCGKRTVMHRKADADAHPYEDAGDKRADVIVAKIKKYMHG